MKTLAPLHLTATERFTLEAWAAASTPDNAARKRSLRASIVLAAASAAASGHNAEAIAKVFHVRPSTVHKWSRRFAQERIDGLNDKPRTGAPRRISDEHVADIVRKTREPTPNIATRWSRRMMSDATGLSRSTIHRIWKAYGIAPTRTAPPNPIVGRS